MGSYAPQFCIRVREQVAIRDLDNACRHINRQAEEKVSRELTKILLSYLNFPPGTRSNREGTAILADYFFTSSSASAAFSLGRIVIFMGTA